MDKWVLVTGASTGIGRATAEYLASHGFNVYAGARKKADLDEISKIPHIHAIQLDVTKEVEIENCVELIRKQNTGLYAVINNAGIAVAGPLMDIETEDIQNQLNVSVLGIHRITKAIFPFLLESHGRIIMMSSDSGFFATPFFGPYCMAKFAVEGYSDSLRRELLLYNVKVVIIQPGRITTPIWDKGQEILTKYPNSIFKEEALKIGEYAIRKGKTAGLMPIEVAKLIHKTLTVEKPKLRYLIAPHKMKYYIIKMLPASRVDKMVEKELHEMKSKKGESKNK